MKHTVHVTNYQQHIDASFLVEQLVSDVADYADALSEAMYASIAYFTINKTYDIRIPYEAKLAISIKGKTYTYKLANNQRHIYEAFIHLQVNQYAYDTGMELKDAHIKIVQAEFERLVFMRSHKIGTDLLNAYNIKIA